MKKEKDKLTWKIVIVISVLIWVAMTSTVQRFKCDSLTETQLFIMIPENFILHFKECK